MRTLLTHCSARIQAVFWRRVGNAFRWVAFLYYDVLEQVGAAPELPGGRATEPRELCKENKNRRRQLLLPTFVRKREAQIKKGAKLDKINRAILTTLQLNARMSNLELAERVGLSPSACLQRTKALEEAGYILQYVMAVDLDKVCVNVMVYVEITLESHRMADFERFEKAIRSIPEFVDCLRVSGRFDYIAFVVCSNVAAFNNLCDDLLTRDLKISRISSNVVLDKPKWFAGYPLVRLEWRAD